MRFDFWFSRRLNLTKNASASTSTGVVIAIVGVALALIIMELTLAIVAGFKHEIERKIIGFNSSVAVLPAYDFNTGASEEFIYADDGLKDIIKTTLPEARPVDVIRSNAVLKTDSDFLAVECIAYGEGHDYAFEESNLTAGTIIPTGDSIVISEDIASKLSLGVDDRVYLYFFVDGKPRARRVSVAGLYNSNFGEFDASVIYTSIDFQRSLGIGAGKSTEIAIENIEVKGVDEIPPLTDNLRRALLAGYQTGKVDKIYQVTDINERGALYISWLNLLDTNVVVIFILMACVAAFTLISSLFIIILDRVQTIGILRALGATRMTVRKIFVNIALKIVGAGLLIGNIVAVGIILLQKWTHFLRLNPEMYYIDSVPFELSWGAALMLNAGVILAAWLILILPAGLASRIDPSTSVRYE